MVHIVKTENIGEFSSQITQMHRLRHKTFADRLQWEVQTSGDMEMDVYDAMAPTYLLKLSDRGDVRGCLRLLPTTGPYMLEEVFPVLLGGRPAPKDPRILEISRFAVDPDCRADARAAGIAATTHELFLGFIEYGLETGLTDLVAVVDDRMEVIVKRAGLCWSRLGPVHRIGRAESVAGLIEVSEQALQRLRDRSGITQPVLKRPQPISVAA